MSDTVQLKVEKRTKSGTGSSRDLRSKNYIPGIIYGEKKDPILISVDESGYNFEYKDYVWGGMSSN